MRGNIWQDDNGWVFLHFVHFFKGTEKIAALEMWCDWSEESFELNSLNWSFYSIIHTVVCIELRKSQFKCCLLHAVGNEITAPCCIVNKQSCELCHLLGWTYSSRHNMIIIYVLKKEEKKQTNKKMNTFSETETCSD